MLGVSSRNIPQKVTPVYCFDSAERSMIGISNIIVHESRSCKPSKITPSVACRLVEDLVYLAAVWINVRGQSDSDVLTSFTH